MKWRWQFLWEIAFAEQGTKPFTFPHFSSPPPLSNHRTIIPSPLPSHHYYNEQISPWLLSQNMEHFMNICFKMSRSLTVWIGRNDVRRRCWGRVIFVVKIPGDVGLGSCPFFEWSSSAGQAAHLNGASRCAPFPQNDEKWWCFPAKTPLFWIKSTP